MSLRDGSKKCRSPTVRLFTINLSDDADTIAQKVRKRRPIRKRFLEVEGLKNRPEADNLAGIFAALNNETKQDVLRAFGGGNFSAFKAALVDLAVTKLGRSAPKCNVSRPTLPISTVF